MNRMNRMNRILILAGYDRIMDPTVKRTASCRQIMHQSIGKLTRLSEEAETFAGLERSNKN